VPVESADFSFRLMTCSHPVDIPLYQCNLSLDLHTTSHGFRQVIIHLSACTLHQGKEKVRESKYSQGNPTARKSRDYPTNNFLERMDLAAPTRPNSCW